MAQGPRDDHSRRNDGTFHRFVKPPKAPIVHSTKDNLQVLYEDNHIVAVNKRCLLYTSPSPRDDR